LGHLDSFRDQQRGVLEQHPAYLERLPRHL
jgi:hypothetical protein